jgi:hypothetical protein
MLNRGKFARYGTALVMALGLVGASANAGVVGVIAITAEVDGVESDPITWTVDGEALATDGYVDWHTTETMGFFTAGNQVAALNPGVSAEWLAANPGQDGSQYSNSGFTYMADPTVTLDFAVQANPAASTTFTIYSALLTFPNITNGTADSSAAFTVSNNSLFGSATLTGASASLGLGTTGGYVAQYNGFPAGSVFSDLHTAALSAVGAFASNSRSEFSGPAIIPGIVSDISSVVKFTVTANDLASGTTQFTIVPEPASLALLSLGLLAIRRR